MKRKMYYTIPGTTNVIRPLVHARCGHGDEVVPLGTGDDCTACWLSRQRVIRGGVIH